MAASPLPKVPWARVGVPRAALAIVLVALVAIGGSLAASGLLAPSTTAPPSLAAAASTTSGSSAPAVVSAVPTAAAFPNAAETRLLTALPPGLRASCVRGRGNLDLQAAGFTGYVNGGAGTQVSVMPTQQSEASRPYADRPRGAHRSLVPVVPDRCGLSPGRARRCRGRLCRSPRQDCGRRLWAATSSKQLAVAIGWIGHRPVPVEFRTGQPALALLVLQLVSRARGSYGSRGAVPGTVFVVAEAYALLEIAQGGRIRTRAARFGHRVFGRGTG